METLFATQALILLTKAKSSKKTVLRLRSLRSVSFIGSKGALVSLLRTMERFYLSKFLELLGRSLCELESKMFRSDF